MIIQYKNCLKMLLHSYILLLLMQYSSGQKVSPEKTLVFGPGLKTHFVMPVRYFFIQAVDEDGNKFTDSVGQDAFTINIVQDSGARARVWPQLLDRHDGTYIARFKMHQSYKDLQIEIKYGNKHVAESPYKLSGQSYHEKCYCPVKNLDKWLDKFSCPSNYRQMNQDLSVFDTIDMKRVIPEAIQRFSAEGRHSICHYVVQDNKVEIRSEGRSMESVKVSHILIGMSYHEKCYCPVDNIDEWLDQMSCPKSIRQIKKDLSIFPKMDFKPLTEEFIKRFGNSPGSMAISHYLVKDNKVYRRTFGEHVGFKMFMDAMLLSVTRKVHLPDMEFFLNLGDWPLEKRGLKDNPLPLFSWCGSDETRDIILPTYDVTESTLETMGRVSLDLMSVQANTGPKWENKSSVAFFRGRDSREERLNVVKMSMKHSHLIDAKLTNMFFFRDRKDEVGELVKHISFFDFFKHKYQLNIDGTVAAYRFPYLLAGDSLVLKQDSKYYEHFYKDLKPYEHYVPFKKDLSDLLEKIQWAKDHDEEAQQIAKNAQSYVRENLMNDDIFCYHVLMFKEYAKKLTSKVEVLDDMELVEQPSDYSAECDCQRSIKKEEKETRDEL